MKTTEIFYDGGSLMNPDNGCVMETISDEKGNYVTTRTLVVFTSFCFNSDGSWRPEVMTALRNLVDGKENLL